MADIPQTVLRARQMYADGVPVRITQAESGFSLVQLYHALDGLPQPNGDSLLPPLARRRIIAGKTVAPRLRRAGRAPDAGGRTAIARYREQLG